MQTLRRRSSLPPQSPAVAMAAGGAAAKAGAARATAGKAGAKSTAAAARAAAARAAAKAAVAAPQSGADASWQALGSGRIPGSLACSRRCRCLPPASTHHAHTLSQDWASFRHRWCRPASFHTLAHPQCPSFLLAGQERGPAPDAGSEERSHYLPWILKDLQPWTKHGIHEVGSAESLASECCGPLQR